MASLGKIARRTFLFGSAAIAGGVALGVWYLGSPAANPLKPAEGETTLNPFVLIDGAGVTIIAPRAEMGQGTQSTWAALVAEEMDLAWDQVRVLHGPPATAYYNTAMMGESAPGPAYGKSAFQHAVGEAMGTLGKPLEMQVTGGSTAMKDGFERMRAAGAAAREMLKGAAANRLGIDAALLRTEAGTVIAPDGTALPYTELAAEAADITPREVQLRDPSEWTLLGRPLPRLDTVAKSTGTAEYSIDVRPEGLRFAALRMSPRRGTMLGYDDSTARTMTGVEKIVDLADGVAVIASNTWLAQQAVAAIEIDWGPAPHAETTDAIMAQIEAAFALDPDSTFLDRGDADRLPEGATEITAEYRVPFLAHAAMEPLNATAHITANGLELWSGNQIPAFTRRSCADAAGLSDDRVTVHTTLMGGGFGRRGELDFSVLATRVAMALPGTPVMTTWSREEDMTHDYYRPAAIARMRGAVKDGTAALFDAAVAGPSTARQALHRWMGFAPPGPDKVHVEGLWNQPYAIANHRARGHVAPDLNVPVGFWRSVGNSYNGFFHESFMDELAHAAGADPLDFRLALAREAWAPAAGVLEAVREMSGWRAKPEGTGRGVAMCFSFGTPVACVIEVAGEDEKIRLTRAWMAADVGVALDPGIIDQQLVGGLVYGLSAAMMGEITFADGTVEQQNFYDYDALRLSQMPVVETRILQTQRHISGIGEPGTPPAAPALANAIFDLTGERHRSLPLNRAVDFWI
ncbi:xanthine dehydrogenase family protein molybdopterin-binding subunit [Salipiger thiooxidans]|uniref:xanthine dehydrogenase family protein molybdopterin-binding subunit n=1 Tax=Salipiger thiooxidans TaxID=282683 RepID=UPI001A8F00BA|nr:molybdopterin cofactor-binding domain-containing protein [Salipiger thiooxidans]MBN8187730.1 xanthine dehydrogenase family protein molybdopterin-binding subunit [Salipiger thiooxidans]